MDANAEKIEDIKSLLNEIFIMLSSPIMRTPITLVADDRTSAGENLQCNCWSEDAIDNVKHDLLSCTEKLEEVA